MKDIFVFAPRFHPQGGGSSIYFSNLVNDLSEEYEFHVLTFINPDEPVKDMRGRATIYRVIPKGTLFPSPIRLAIESITSFLLTMFILSKDIDIAHVHAASFATPGITLATYLWRIPIIYDCRDEMFPPWLVKLGHTSIWFSCASNIDSILIKNGIPKEKIMRVPVVNPPYVKDYSNRSSNENIQNGLDIIYVGRLVEKKGVHLLLTAFEKFVQEHPDAHLTLVGDDPVGNIVQLIAEKELREHLTLTGELNHRNAIKQMSTSDVLILPSYDEGLPRVVIEAFELGIPVIATPVGGIPDIIKDYETGLLVNHTSQSILSALTTLYENDQLRHTISTEAQRKSQDWNWETAITQVSIAYDQVLTSE